ncbi:FtsX-like permease family protein [Candidatus Poribacteria bacterium]|nr:FtsX-like permease family protein [Candidatus Poribacteria bacterium]
MRSLEGVLQGFRGIFENKLRSGLTTLGITIGIAAVLSMVSISDGAERIILDDLEKLGGNNQFGLFRSDWVEKNGRWQRNTSSEYFTYDDVLAIERECKSVLRVIPRVPRFGGVRMTAGSGAAATETMAGYQATTETFMEGMKWRPEEGRFITEDDNIDWDKVVVVGSTVAEELFGDADPLGAEMKIGNDRFTVVGVMEPRGTSIQFGFELDRTTIIPLSTAQRRFNGNDQVPMLTVQAVSTEKIPKAVEEVQRLLKRRHGSDDFFNTWLPGGQNLEFVTKLTRMLRWVLGGIAGFSLFIGGVGIMNIMLVTVTERTKEIGLRKAIGARRRDILTQFLIEASTLCITGGVLGLILGILFGWGSATVMSSPQIGGFVGGLLGFQGKWVAWPWSVPVVWIFISMGVALAVGVFFGLYPAWKAARLTPIEALRHQ